MNQLLLILITFFSFIGQVQAIPANSEWSVTSKDNNQMFLYSILTTARDKIIEVFMVFEEDPHSLRARPLYKLVFINSYLKKNKRLHLQLEKEFLIPLSEKLKSKYECRPITYSELSQSEDICAIDLKTIPDFSSLTSGPGEGQVIKYELSKKGLIVHRREGRMLLKRSSYYKRSQILQMN